MTQGDAETGFIVRNDISVLIVASSIPVTSILVPEVDIGLWDICTTSSRLVHWLGQVVFMWLLYQKLDVGHVDFLVNIQ